MLYPVFFFFQNAAIWGILSVLKYVIMDLKINNFKDNFLNSTNY